jgi:tetratricopeptide (TPR) repeat protein
MQTLSLDRGLRLLAQKEFQAVHANCISTIKKDIKSAVAYFLLGVIADEHGNHDKAVELFRTAESYDGSEPHYPAYLAKTLSTLRRQNEAKAAADRASLVIGNNAYLIDSVAVVYSRAGFHEDAIVLFKRALELENGQANMHYNLGASAQFVGDFDLAATSYRAALKLDSTFYRAWASLVYLDKQTVDNNFLQNLVRLFELNDQNSDAQLQLGHAIAKTYEDLGDFESSLTWLHRAKESKKSEFGYDRVASGKTFDAAKRTYTKGNYAPRDVLETEHASPIFIVGLPRTGTTLVDRILSSHSKVTSAGELNIFSRLVKGESGTASNLVLDAETLANTDGIDLTRIGHDYIELSRELARGSEFMIDKMPLNFFYPGLIHQALPNARIIALRRGALDSCMSNFRQLFSTQYSFYNYTFELNDTAWFYKRFDDLMNHWKAVLPADRFTEVRYEDIVFDQEVQTRRLLDFCELGWEDACMNFHQNTAPVSTASSVQVRQPLYSGSIGRWKKYGNHIDGLRAALGNIAD